MSRQDVVIAEAKLSALVVLTSIPLGLMLLLSAALIFGWGNDNGMYYRSYGPVVFIFFYGGGLYVVYEFSRTIFRRHQYISLIGDRIIIPYHSPININDISRIHTEDGLFSKNIVISRRENENTKIRAYLLKDSAEIVEERLRFAIDQARI